MPPITFNSVAQVDYRDSNRLRTDAVSAIDRGAKSIIAVGEKIDKKQQDEYTTQALAKINQLSGREEIEAAKADFAREGGTYGDIKAISAALQGREQKDRAEKTADFTYDNLVKDQADQPLLQELDVLKNNRDIEGYAALSQRIQGKAKGQVSSDLVSLQKEELNRDTYSLLTSDGFDINNERRQEEVIASMVDQGFHSPEEAKALVESIQAQTNQDNQLIEEDVRTLSERNATVAEKYDARITEAQADYDILLNENFDDANLSKPQKEAKLIQLHEKAFNGSTDENLEIQSEITRMYDEGIAFKDAQGKVHTKKVPLGAIEVGLASGAFKGDDGVFFESDPEIRMNAFRDAVRRAVERNERGDPQATRQELLERAQSLRDLKSKRGDVLRSSAVDFENELRGKRGQDSIERPYDSALFNDPAPEAPVVNQTVQEIEPEEIDYSIQNVTADTSPEERTKIVAAKRDKLIKTVSDKVETVVNDMSKTKINTLMRAANKVEDGSEYETRNSKRILKESLTRQARDMLSKEGFDDVPKDSPILLDTVVKLEQMIRSRAANNRSRNSVQEELLR